MDGIIQEAIPEHAPIPESNVKRAKRPNAPASFASVSSAKSNHSLGKPGSALGSTSALSRAATQAPARTRSQHRPPPVNLAGPSHIPILARDGSYNPRPGLNARYGSRNSSTRAGGGGEGTNTDGGYSENNDTQQERRRVWGIGGVLPKPTTREKSIAKRRERDYEAERGIGTDFRPEEVAPTQRLRRRTRGQSISTRARSPEIGIDDLTKPVPVAVSPILSPTIEQADPFLKLPTIPPPVLARTRTWPPFPRLIGQANENFQSGTSSPAETIVDPQAENERKQSENSDDSDSETSSQAHSDAESHNDEQVQIGGALMEENEQWQDEFDHDLEDVPVSNSWGKLRFVLREPLAEFLGMVVLICLGAGADCQVRISQFAAGSYSDQNWTWGFGVMCSIYIAGGISGGHINPAITITLAIFRGFPWRMVPRYVLAQVLGAFVGALIIYGNYKNALRNYDPNKLIFTSSEGNASAALFITVPQDSLGGATAGFFQEILATSILSIVVLALGDENNAPPGAGLGALVLGFVVTAIGMSQGWISGYAINSARDLGPRLALYILGYGTELWTHSNYWWILGPIVGTTLGAIIGAFLYDFCIFVGAGSPVNASAADLAHQMKLPRMHNMVLKAFRAPSAESKENSPHSIESGYSQRSSSSSTLASDQTYDQSRAATKQKNKEDVKVKYRWRKADSRVKGQRDQSRKSKERKKTRARDATEN